MAAAVTSDLMAAHDEIMVMIRMIPDQALDWRPGGDDWSFRQIITHLAHANDFYVMIIDEARSSNFGNVKLHEGNAGWQRMAATNTEVDRCATVQAALDCFELRYQNMLAVLWRITPEELDRPFVFQSWQPGDKPLTTTLRRRVIQMAAEHLREHLPHLVDTLTRWSAISADSFVHLEADEVLPDRAFTHPDHSQADLTVLEHMRARLREVLVSAALSTDRPYPWHMNLHEANGRRHRIIILNRKALLEADELAFVGFRGHKRAHIDPASLHAMAALDAELVNELLAHPRMLSYSSIELEDGNWINLVLLSSPEGIQHWRTSEKHIYGVSALAPHYYDTIRLHNGLLPRGLSSPKLILLRTKYYDFQGEAHWRAMRGDAES